MPDAFNLLITHDPSTWPHGDRVWDICRAIAFAEGADKAGANPDRLNNPGDISDYRHVFGCEQHSGSFITRFPGKIIGWSCLYVKIAESVNGFSDVFRRNFTWEIFAQHYAGNWRPWLKIVTEHLKVLPSSTPAEYVLKP